MKLAPFVLAAGLVALPAMAQETSKSVDVALKGPEGEDLGSATLTQGAKGVLLHVEAKGLTPGWHGIHLHDKGDCSDAAFKSAGGHVHSAMPMVHGLLNPKSNEAGDLPNLYAQADGEAKGEFFSTMVSLSKADGPVLTDADGSALVIHAKPDDHKTQPIGGAGDRVACGVIK